MTTQPFTDQEIVTLTGQNESDAATSLGVNGCKVVLLPLGNDQLVILWKPEDFRSALTVRDRITTADVQRRSEPGLIPIHFVCVRLSPNEAKQQLTEL